MSFARHMDDLSSIPKCVRIEPSRKQHTPNQQRCQHQSASHKGESAALASFVFIGMSLTDAFTYWKMRQHPCGTKDELEEFARKAKASTLVRAITYGAAGLTMVFYAVFKRPSAPV